VLALSSRLPFRNDYFGVAAGDYGLGLKLTELCNHVVIGKLKGISKR
jgi:hypothetical protein